MELENVFMNKKGCKHNVKYSIMYWVCRILDTVKCVFCRYSVEHFKADQLNFERRKPSHLQPCWQVFIVIFFVIWRALSAILYFAQCSGPFWPSACVLKMNCCSPLHAVTYYWHTRQFRDIRFTTSMISDIFCLVHFQLGETFKWLFSEFVTFQSRGYHMRDFFLVHVLIEWKFK